MNIDETYNIHKKINCVFPFFKSKFLCKKGIHNYCVNPSITVIPITYAEEDETHTYEITKVTDYQKVYEINLKCLCCRKEEKFDE